MEVEEVFDGVDSDSEEASDGGRLVPFGIWSKATAQAKPLKVLLYGPSGSGKTRMAATFPKPVFLDLEDGLRSTLEVGEVLRYPEDPSKSVTNIKQVNQFYKLVREAARAGDRSFETIVIDSLNELVVLVTNNILSQFTDQKRLYDDQLTMQDYGKLNRDFLKIVNLFLKLPYNVVFTCVETPRQYEDSQVMPKLPGNQIGPEVQRLMDMIGYCHVVKSKDKDGKFEHYVSFHMSPKYVAKDRMGIARRDVPNNYSSLINS